MQGTFSNRIKLESKHVKTKQFKPEKENQIDTIQNARAKSKSREIKRAQAQRRRCHARAARKFREAQVLISSAKTYNSQTLFQLILLHIYFDITNRDRFV